MLEAAVVNKIPEINSVITILYLTLLIQLVKGHGDVLFG